jgi:DNA recombination protein RmuC
MEFVPYLAFLIVGVLLGAGCALVVGRNTALRAAASERASGEGERARLQAQLEGAEKRTAELSTDLLQKESSIARLQEDRAQEIERRSAAEEMAKRIPLIEAEAAAVEQRMAAVYDRLVVLEATKAELATALDKERAAYDEKLQVIDVAEKRLAHTFSALSADALRSNNQSFLDLARTTLEKFQESAKTDLEQRQRTIADLVAPVTESLSKVDVKIQEMEVARMGAYEGLKQHVSTLVETQNQLRTETSNLVRALRSPGVRGRWGEVQLRRVIEMAGMVAHCDFCEQESITTDAGRLRPDVTVKLPGGRTIVVDSKVPLEAYLDAVEMPDDDARREKMRDHARQLRNHITALSKKSYWEMFQPAPEFVLLFLPGEMFYSAALEQDPMLIEYGVEQRVILATPTTLIALLKAVAYGWRQESLADNAQKISDLGRELYERLGTMSEHFTRLGKSLSNSVEAYNRAVGSVESRVLVAARKFKELSVTGAGGEEIVELVPVEQSIRAVQAPELSSIEFSAPEASV